MKQYFLQASKYLNQKTGAIREQYDIVRNILSVMQFLNAAPIEEISCSRENADVLIVVDKMSRLFWGKNDKIHSVQFPFLLKEKEGYLITLFQDRVVDAQTIAILLTVLNDKESINQSIENMLDCFMDTMNEFGIRDQSYAQFCWSLLLYLLSFETGYLRYDHDEDKNRMDAILHPVDHIDFFYSGNNTFKVGLPKRIAVDDLKKILNINEKSYFLNYS